MALSSKTMARVARADIAMDWAFAESISDWHSGAADLPFISGNCTENQSFKYGGQIHVDGDLDAEISGSGLLVIVIAGDVSERGVVKCSGACHVFIGGEFNGSMQFSHTSRIWIGSNCNGRIETGSPSTYIHVEGNCSGDIRPYEERALLKLIIDGSATSDYLSTIANLGYTLFHAHAATSDAQPGVYGKTLQEGKGRRIWRWSVESQVAIQHS
jgi:cytoskeletal protein CcmA (bactofilin family)